MAWHSEVAAAVVVVSEQAGKLSVNTVWQMMYVTSPVTNECHAGDGAVVAESE